MVKNLEILNLLDYLSNFHQIWSPKKLPVDLKGKKVLEELFSSLQYIFYNQYSRDLSIEWFWSEYTLGCH